MELKKHFDGSTGYFEPEGIGKTIRIERFLPALKRASKDQDVLQEAAILAQDNVLYVYHNRLLRVEYDLNGNNYNLVAVIGDRDNQIKRVLRNGNGLDNILPLLWCRFKEEVDNGLDISIEGRIYQNNQKRLGGVVNPDVDKEGYVSIGTLNSAGNKIRAKIRHNNLERNGIILRNIVGSLAKSSDVYVERIINYRR